MINIELNGQPHQTPANQSVQDLIEQLQLTHQALAVAVNREVLPRAQWSQRRLQANDSLDLVRPIGGG